MKLVFTRLLCFRKSFSKIANTRDHVKCISLNSQQCVIQPNLINLHPNEHSQELRYYPFAVNLDRCMGSCNALQDISSKLCVPNKTEDLSLSAFNIMTGINESKILA